MKRPNYYCRTGEGDPWRSLLAAIFIRAARDLRLKNQTVAQDACEFLVTPQAREWLVSEFNIFNTLPPFAQQQLQPCLIEARYPDSSDHLVMEVN